MAEYKQYITQTQENGTVMISEDVVSTIVEHAVSDVEGVAGIVTKPVADFADLPDMHRFPPRKRHYYCKRVFSFGMILQPNGPPRKCAAKRGKRPDTILL